MISLSKAKYLLGAVVSAFLILASAGCGSPADQHPTLDTSPSMTRRAAGEDSESDTSPGSPSPSPTASASGAAASQEPFIPDSGDTLPPTSVALQEGAVSFSLAPPTDSHWVKIDGQKLWQVEWNADRQVGPYFLVSDLTGMYTIESFRDERYLNNPYATELPFTVSEVATDSSGYRYFTAEYIADWTQMTKESLLDGQLHHSSQFEIVKEFPTSTLSCGVVTNVGSLPPGATVEIHEQFYLQAKAACETMTV